MYRPLCKVIEVGDERFLIVWQMDGVKLEGARVLYEFREMELCAKFIERFAHERSLGTPKDEAIQCARVQAELHALAAGRMVPHPH